MYLNNQKEAEMKSFEEIIQEATYLLDKQKERLLNDLEGSEIDEDVLKDRMIKTVEEVFRSFFDVSVNDLAPSERGEIERIARETAKEQMPILLAIRANH